jgi:hypothetical protein
MAGQPDQEEAINKSNERGITRSLSKTTISPLVISTPTISTQTTTSVSEDDPNAIKTYREIKMAKEKEKMAKIMDNKIIFNNNNNTHLIGCEMNASVVSAFTDDTVKQSKMFTVRFLVNFDRILGRLSHLFSQTYRVEITLRGGSKNLNKSWVIFRRYNQFLEFYQKVKIWIIED